MMVDMRNIDDVSEVVLGKSERPESTQTAAVRRPGRLLRRDAAPTPTSPSSRSSSCSETRTTQTAATAASRRLEPLRRRRPGTERGAIRRRRPRPEADSEPARPTHTRWCDVSSRCVGAFWLLALAPKRRTCSKLDSDVQTSEQSYQSAREEAQQFARTRDSSSPATTRPWFGSARRFRPIPDMPSLVVQLDRAAARRASTSGSSTSTRLRSAPPRLRAPAAATAPPASSEAAARPVRAVRPAALPRQSDCEPRPARRTRTLSRPRRFRSASTVGPAGLPMLSSTSSSRAASSAWRTCFTTSGVSSRDEPAAVVSGRLLTIDGISLSEGDFGFPQGQGHDRRHGLPRAGEPGPVRRGDLAGAGRSATAAPDPGAAATSSSAPPAAVVTAPMNLVKAPLSATWSRSGSGRSPSLLVLRSIAIPVWSFEVRPGSSAATGAPPTDPARGRVRAPFWERRSRS